ncbi:hypothetical protein MTR_3g109240 [Medicago truncatula]|uniref:Uncharacterized protein n=1 Tax=Medicago truncatula TaxID=3880 RepID=G7J2V3_MEDTR|nr:hypothetical protein MTR_3g109240 [Medicago truncatula]
MLLDTLIGQVSKTRLDLAYSYPRCMQMERKNNSLISQGTYMLKDVNFSGPYSFATNNWINFRYVNKLTVGGGGTLDGQGSSGESYASHTKGMYS